MVHCCDCGDDVDHARDGVDEDDAVVVGDVGDGFAVVPGFVDDGDGCVGDDWHCHCHSHFLLLFVQGWILTNALHRTNVEIDPGIVPVLEFHFHFHAWIEVD